MSNHLNTHSTCKLEAEMKSEHISE